MDDVSTPRQQQLIPDHWKIGIALAASILGFLPTAGSLLTAFGISVNDHYGQATADAFAYARGVDYALNYWQGDPIPSHNDTTAREAWLNERLNEAITQVQGPGWEAEAIRRGPGGYRNGYDPWGNPFRSACIGTPAGFVDVIYSIGKNGLDERATGDDLAARVISQSGRAQWFHDGGGWYYPRPSVPWSPFYLTPPLIIVGASLAALATLFVAPRPRLRWLLVATLLLASVAGTILMYLASADLTPTWRSGGITLYAVTWLTAATCATTGIAAFIRAQRFNRTQARLAANRCPSCNYDITGLTSNTCPECGTRFTRPANQAKPAPPPDPQTSPTTNPKTAPHSPL